MSLKVEEVLACLSSTNRDAQRLVAFVHRLLEVARSGTEKALRAEVRAMHDVVHAMETTEYSRRLINDFIDISWTAFLGHLHANVHAAALGGCAMVLSEIDEAIRRDKEVNAELWLTRAVLRSLADFDLADFRQRLTIEYQSAQRRLPARIAAAAKAEREERIRQEAELRRESKEFEQCRKNRAADAKARKKRDAYVYRQYCKGTPIKTIIAHVLAHQDWPALSRPPSVLRAVRSYAKRQGLPLPRRKKWTRTWRGVRKSS